MTQLDRIEAMLVMILEALGNNDEPQAFDMQGEPIPKDRDETQPL